MSGPSFVVLECFEASAAIRLVDDGDVGCSIFCVSSLCRAVLAATMAMKGKAVNWLTVSTATAIRFLIAITGQSDFSQVSISLRARSLA